MATRQGHHNVVSVPGSGKTTVFSKRAADILLEGCPVHKFLGLTFTKSAAEQLEARTIKAGWKPRQDDPRIFRTFHGFALDFAKRYCNSFPFPVQKFPLLLPQEQYKVLGPILKQMPKRPKYKDLQSYISEMKRRDIDPEQAMREAEGELGPMYARAYSLYEQKCIALGKFDFDSLLAQSVRLLETRTDILTAVQPYFLQCDEAQDNDKIQWRLIQLLGSKNVFCVGDPNQNMYSWRGSQANGLTSEFSERFPGARTTTLSINYRSTQAIVDYLNEIMPVKVDGMVMQASPANGVGTPPTFKKYMDENQEAEMILMALTQPEETVILARTNRQLASFEKAAAKMELKYKLLGKSGFFSQPEVEFCVAHAQYCAGAATDDSIKKIIKSPYDATRFLRKAEVIERLEQMQAGSLGQVKMARLIGQYHSGDHEQDRYVRELHARLEDTRRQVMGKGSQDALRNVVTNFGILRYYEDDEDAIDNNPADNVMSLLRMAEKCATLLDFVQLCHKAKQASRSTAKRLTFSTVHQAKGLEWRHVYVIGVNSDVLPHKDGDLDEEKRIYFVACSRASKELHVSCNEGASSFFKHKVSSEENAQAEVDFLQVMYQNAVAGTV